MKYIISIVLLSVLFSCCNTPASKLKTGLEGKEMPSFDLLLMDSLHQLNTQKISGEKPVVFILISPSCPFCRALTKDIVSNIKSLENIQFYIISSYPFDQIKSYYSEFRLGKYSNIIVGQDYTAYSENYFNAAGVPYIAVYNKGRKLRQVFIGKINPDIIKTYCE